MGCNCGGGAKEARRIRDTTPHPDYQPPMTADATPTPAAPPEPVKVPSTDKEAAK